MRRARRKYVLLVYRRMLDRWWPVVFLIGLALLAVWWVSAQGLEPPTELWREDVLLLMLSLFVLVCALILFLMGRMAYVQAHAKHLRLVTPFLPMNISYKRIRRTSSASMQSLFPPSRLTNWQREILEPLAGKTAIVIELTSMPLPQSTLRFFLSPFFFKDKTPHLVILVQDWLNFSTELDSRRTGGDIPQEKTRSPASILSRLPRQDQ